MRDPTQRESPRRVRFDGRIERRVTTEIRVRLASQEQPRNGERTVTENISPHGARLLTQRFWGDYEQPLITPLTGEFQQPARVVYCQARAKGGYYLGVAFPERMVRWEGWLLG